MMAQARLSSQLSGTGNLKSTERACGHWWPPDTTQVPHVPGLDSYSSEHVHGWQHSVSFALLRRGLGTRLEDTVLKEHLLALSACANWNSSLIFPVCYELDQCKIQRLKVWISPQLSCIKSVSRPPEEKSQTPCESRYFTQLSGTYIVYGKSNPVGRDEA